MPSSNLKIIARNTLMLYIRTLVTMGVTLYTSRIILKVLGIEDWGIYNIVGSIVIFFTFFNSAMSGGTQRFLTFELGRSDFKRLSEVFSVSIVTHAGIVLLVLILAETVGVWFVNSQLNISPERMNAANWVYQFSLLTFIVQIMMVPYNATIIAHEKMSFYAYLSLLDVVLKLLLVWGIRYIAWDKLILYAVFVFMVTVIVWWITYVYAVRRFGCCRYVFVNDKAAYKQLMIFSGWNLVGCSADIGVQQGQNVLLNLFWGVAINAAMGIANQVSSALQRLVSNFQTAFNPQIVKLYAMGQTEELTRLVFRASKYSFYLMLFLSVPVVLEMNWILGHWLKTVPEYTAVLCRLSIAAFLLETFSAPLAMIIAATGRIRKYQIILSLILLLNLPVSYVFLKNGYQPSVVLTVRLGFILGVLFTRMLFLKSMLNFRFLQYGRLFLFNVVVVGGGAVILPWILHICLCYGTGRFLTVCVSSVMSTACVVAFLGMTKAERFYMTEQIKMKLKGILK